MAANRTLNKKEGTGMGRIPCLPGSLIRRNEATETVNWKVGDNDVFPQAINTRPSGNVLRYVI